MKFEKPFSYLEADLDKNEFSKELSPAIKYLRNYDSQKRALIITGNPGSGKTWLMWAFLDWIYKKDEKARLDFVETKGGYFYDREKKTSYYKPDIYYQSLMNSIKYITTKEIIEGIKSEWKTNDCGYYLNVLRQVKFLIIDEIGVNYGSQSERIELYGLFNYRWENGLPTVIISNLNKEELYDNLGERIVDRIYHGAVIVNMTNGSRRS